MNLTYEQIYSALPNLGPAERHWLCKALAHMLGVAVNETDPAAVAVGSLTSRELNDQWLAANEDNYRGQWVALKDGALIAHSSDGKAFVKAVKDSGVDCPFLLLIPLPKDLIRASCPDIIALFSIAPLVYYRSCPSLILGSSQK